MRTNLKEEFPSGEIPGAIILGGNFLGLGIARSLGRRGIPVWVIDTGSSKSIAQYSRYTKCFIASTEPVNELLLREGKLHNLQGWVLFSGSDDYVEALSTHREALSAIFRVTTPPLAITSFALDKRLTYRRAAELGIAVPWTWFGEALADLREEDIPYPVILKPAVNHHFFPQTNLKALAANDSTELHRTFAQMSQYIPPSEILIQERIPGNGENQFSYCGICDNGRVSVSLVAQRRRQYPIEFGNASTFVETASQTEIEWGGRRFLESIKFDGMGEVEFKFDPRDGKHKILDVNSRPWGWHTLGQAAGVDFSYVLWRQKVGLRAAAMTKISAQQRGFVKSPTLSRYSRRTTAAAKSRDCSARCYTASSPAQPSALAIRFLSLRNWRCGWQSAPRANKRPRTFFTCNRLAASPRTCSQVFKPNSAHSSDSGLVGGS